MNGLVPADNASPGMLSPLTSGTGTFGERLRAFAAQPPVRKVLPLFAGTAGLGLLALTWATLSPAPQRTLYSSLGDGERASVVATLDQAGIDYTIDNNTGALTVGEDDVYRARMLVASDGSLAAPESGADLIENLPMGASRTLEGDRLRAAQERELMMTIMEIDGVEAVRVHIAKAERSVFVREDVAPSASIMVRMARGRQLADGQVTAIANLVAGSVPGLGIDAVKVIDQHGKLLTSKRDPNSGRMDLQAQMEAKLNALLDKLNALDVEPVLSNLNKTLSASESLVKRLDKTAGHVDSLLGSEAVQKLPGDISTSIDNLNRTLDGLTPDSSAYRKLEGDLERLDRVLKKAEPLLDTLEKNPSSLIFDKPTTRDPIPRAQ